MDDTFRKLFEQQNQFQKMLDDAMGPTERLREQMEKLLQPSPFLKEFDRMREQIEGSMPGDRVKDYLDRVGALGDPLYKQVESMRKLQESLGVSDRVGAIDQSIRALTDQVPEETINARIVEPTLLLTTPPEPPKTPAARMFDRMMSELEAEREEHEDARHTVFLRVYLPKRSMLVERMSTEDGDMIVFEGLDADTREPCTEQVGALGFQYDFVTFEHRPNLYIVE